MKTIYLVRHGQSVANAKDVLGGKAVPLSELGQKQALTMSDRFSHIHIDKLIASDFVRAQQTVLPISTLKSMSVTIESVFGEFLEPSEFFGSAEDAPEVLAYRAERNAKVESDPDWTHGDGESMAHFMQRINQARVLLENCTEETIAVVSHAYFITSFIAAILLDTQVPSEDWFSVLKKLKLTNTGISVLKYKNGEWHVSTFNDRAHFAE
jgi:broad specificity phosphatase PhoE